MLKWEKMEAWGSKSLEQCSPHLLRLRVARVNVDNREKRLSRTKAGEIQKGFKVPDVPHGAQQEMNHTTDHLQENRLQCEVIAAGKTQVVICHQSYCWSTLDNDDQHKQDKVKKITERTEFEKKPLAEVCTRTGIVSVI